MVTTRRQSGKSPPPLIANIPDDGIREMDESNDPTYAEGESSTPRPSKRAKITSSADKPTGPAVKDLAALPFLPEDVLYEIFGHLNPLDLIRLTRANKHLRKVLLSRPAKSVWKSARQSIKGLPACPVDLSERQYARLAFDDICHGCSRQSKVFKVDWALRIRCCVPCFRNHLVSSEQFEKRYPELPHKIMDLLPYSDNNASALQYDIENQVYEDIYYWEPAILAMAKRLEKLRDNVRLNKAGAIRDLKIFKLDTKAQVPKILEHAEACEAWATATAEDRAREHAATRNRRAAAIKAKLRKLNWSDQDLELIAHHPAFDPARDLTDLIWTRIRPQLEARRREGTVETRRAIVSSLYETYKYSVPIPERGGLPTLTEVQGFEDFVGFIDAPTETAIDASHFANAIQHLPVLILQWARQQRRELLSQLPSLDGGNDRVESRLNLATSMLKCRAPHQCTVPVMCSEALVHTCSDPVHRSPAHRYSNSPRSFSFWSEASTAVRDMVLSLQLDPNVVTGADLDILDPRLLCLECPPKTSENGKKYQNTLTWRSCIVHFCTIHHGASKSKWQVLSEEETAQIKAAEGRSRDHYTYAWYCNICPIPQGNPVLRSYIAIQAHIRHKHYGARAAPGMSFCRDPTIWKTEQPSLPFGDTELLDSILKNESAEQEKLFLCMHCNGHIKPLKGGSNMRAHFRDHHEIPNPVQPGDYTSASEHAR